MPTFKDEFIKTKDEFIKTCKSHDQVYIYGAGINAKKLYDILKKSGIAISGFYVSDTGENPEFLFDLPVMPIEAFINDDRSLIIVSVPAEREAIYCEIREKLQKLGIGNFCSLSRSFYSHFEDRELTRHWKNGCFNISSAQPANSGLQENCRQPKVTLLLPSFNSGKYIAETLASVCGQTLADIEILCIDAGSTDGTADIIRQYAARDRRIRLVTFPIKSYGAQMNHGIQEARGEYIGIVETDDFIAPQMCHDMYQHAVRHDADFVKADFDIFTDGFPEGRLFLRVFYEREIWDENHCFSFEDYQQLKLPVDVFIWTGIYRRAWLLENRIVFQETPGAAFQDYGFRHQAAFAVKRGFFLNRSYYRYRRDNSASSMFSPKSPLFNYNETEFLIRLARERNWPKEHLAFLTRYFVNNALNPACETLLFSRADAGVKDAIENFRSLFRELINEGLLSTDNTGKEEYFRAKMFVENPASVFQYLFLREEANTSSLRQLLERLAPKKEIVLCGRELFFSRLYAALRTNGIDTIRAVASYSQAGQPARYMGLPLDFPEKIAARFPHAHYVVCGTAGCTRVLQKRLAALGVPESEITATHAWLEPFRSLLPIFRDGEEYRRVFAKCRDLRLF